jgi:hypothetical protein
MPFEVTPLIPVIGTVAAALVAGGIARANLIASKETKVSEFRQAWINALRDDLAALFSNTRTLARAVEESRGPQLTTPDKFHIEQSKITAVRHGAAETYHRIRLRLNGNQCDHNRLRRLLALMMGAQQAYMANKTGDVSEPINAVERAASYAEKVLKSEWETVKYGERAYRDSVRATKYTLIGSFAVLAALVVGIPVYYYWSPSTQAATVANHAPAAQPKTAPATAPTPALVPAAIRK